MGLGETHTGNTLKYTPLIITRVLSPWLPHLIVFCVLLPQLLLRQFAPSRGEHDVFEGPVGQARAAPTFLLQTIVKCAVDLVIVLDVIPRYVRFELLYAIPLCFLREFPLGLGLL